jgi:hypothetical protein
MPLLVVQRGHVPRTSGATGTAGEQQVVTAIAAAIVAQTPVGWQVRVIDADPPNAAYAGDYFIALHCDGGASSAQGASVGFPDLAGSALAQRWKAAYVAQGWPYGFRDDNYTSGLRGYYAYDNALAQGNRVRMVAEHGFLTNTQDAAWIRANIDKCAAAAWVAVAGAQPNEEEEPVRVVKLEIHDGWQPFWLMVAPGLTDRIYTSNPDEVEKLAKEGWEFGDVAFSVSTTDPTNTLSLYRGVLGNGRHLLTTDQTELPAAGYEGIVAYVGRGGAQVRRLYGSGDHILTTRPDENPADYDYEGIAFGCGVAVENTAPSDAVQHIANLEARLDRVTDLTKQILAATAD